MLNYEWANPSTIMFNGDAGGAGGGLEELIAQSIQTRDHHIIDHNHHSHNFNDASIVNPHDFFNHMLNNPNFYDPQSSSSAVDCIHQSPSPPPLLSLEMDPAGSFVLMPKLESPYVCNIDFSNNLNRIGLNLVEADILNQLARRSMPLMEGGLINSPKCQVEGCSADLSHARHYHRRHKVCEFHSKASTVVTGGFSQRYCQQCSRFHILSEFDEGKRSCRKRLADHNRRRRKSSHNEASTLKNVTGGSPPAPDP